MRGATTLAAVLAVAVAATADEGPLLELVHIAAGEGGSSGGHVALRLGDRAFHYQARHDGQLRLKRDPWPAFLVHYNLLGNRSLARARLALPPDRVTALEARLDRLHAVEGRHRAVSKALAFERRVLEALAAGEEEAAVEGGGLFAGSLRAAAPEGDPHGLRLLAALDAAPGTSPDLPPVPRTSEPLPPLALERDRYALTPDLAGERMRERLLLAAALDAIARARPLAPGLLIAASERPLSPGERRWLRLGAVRLESRIAALLGSRRPDRGHALLVATARHRAALASLGAGRLLTLDPFASAPLRPEDEGLRVSPEPLARLAADLGRAHELLHAHTVASGAVGEGAWHALETAAARLHEAERGLALGSPLRVEDARPVPSRRGPLPLAVLGLGPPDPAALQRARDNLQRYDAALAQLYDYDLLTRNCATELAGLLGVADAPGAFVPALFFDAAARRLPVADTRSVPSHRLRRLAAMRATTHPLWLQLREGNVLSSTLYGGAPEDGAFLFFTDDVFWPRPLYGAANLGYAALYTGGGLLRAPFDGGETFVRGARGVLFSLPELAFANLRKGSFEYLPEVAALWGAPRR